MDVYIFVFTNVNCERACRT